jgi:hypothetical protein
VVDPRKVRQALASFLAESHFDADVTGPPEAHALLKELKMSQSRKRDNKHMTKALKEAAPQDKRRAEHAAWLDVEDRYANTLVRFPIGPADWVHDEFPGEEGHEVKQMLIKTGRFLKLVEMHKIAEMLITLKPEFQDVLTTLKNYVEGHHIDGAGIACVRLICGSGHGRILRAAARLLFGPRTKQRTIWISGVASSGKSQFIRRLRRVLASDEIDWRGLYLPVRERNHPHIKTQLVTSEEFNWRDAFAEHCKHVTKLLFEGK